MTSTASSDGGPAGRSAARGKRPDGAVLHRAEHATVVVEVDRPPLAPLLLDALDPALLRGRAVPARLPPDALATDAPARSASVPRVRPATRWAHQAAGAADLVDDHVDRAWREVGHLREVLGHPLLHGGADRGHVGAPVDREVELDGHRAVLVHHAHPAMPGHGALDEPAHARRSPGRRRRRSSPSMSAEMTECPSIRDSLRRRQPAAGERSTSSVTSGRAKNRNGTNVVPVPGEMCSVPAGVE